MPTDLAKKKSWSRLKPVPLQFDAFHRFPQTPTTLKQHIAPVCFELSINNGCAVSSPSIKYHIISYHKNPAHLPKTPN